MAIAALSVWEVRPTVGSDTNGGGFVPGASGTDYSQQNSAQYALVNGVTNGTTTIATVSAAADMVGNLVYVQGGTGSITAGWYQITAASVGVSITVDRSTGLTTGTGVTLNIGGALATVATAIANGVSCNTVWIKNTGTYTVTSGITVPSTLNSGANSTGGAAFQVIGYGTTRGDSTHVSWTTATNSVNLLAWSMSAASSGGFVFQKIDFSNTAGTRGAAFFIGNNGGQVYNLNLVDCTFNGFTNAVSSGNGNTSSFNGLRIVNCEVRSCTGVGVGNGVPVFIVDSYIHDNGSHGISIGSSGTNGVGQSSVLLRTTCYNNTGDGFQQASGSSQNGMGLIAINCNFSTNGSVTGNGINWATATGGNGPGSLIVANCTFVSNVAYGISTTVSIGASGSLLTFFGITNAFYSNGLGQINANLINILPSTDITLTGSPYTAPGSGDFTLNSTSGAGAACKAAGFQGTLAGASNAGQAIDVGAIQSSGGGSVTNIIGALNRTIVLTEEDYA